MARFGDVAELASFLGKLDADYAEYAPALWQKGIKTPRQLANFSEPHYLACDVPEGHIDDIKARADATGELLPCNTLYKHTCGVGNSVHVAQGFAAGCTGIRKRCHKEVKQHPHSLSVCTDNMQFGKLHNADVAPIVGAMYSTSCVPSHTSVAF